MDFFHGSFCGIEGTIWYRFTSSSWRPLLMRTQCCHSTFFSKCSSLVFNFYFILHLNLYEKRLLVNSYLDSLQTGKWFLFVARFKHDSFWSSFWNSFMGLALTMKVCSAKYIWVYMCFSVFFFLLGLGLGIRFCNFLWSSEAEDLPINELFWVFSDSFFS